MIGEEDPRWVEAINQMQAAERQMPEEPVLAIGAVQNLAEAIVQIEHVLDEKNRAVLISIGAMLWREANKEAKAALQLTQALRRAAPDEG